MALSWNHTMSGAESGLLDRGCMRKWLFEHRAYPETRSAKSLRLGSRAPFEDTWSFKGLAALSCYLSHILKHFGTKLEQKTRSKFRGARAPGSATECGVRLCSTFNYIQYFGLNSVTIGFLDHELDHKIIFLIMLILLDTCMSYTKIRMLHCNWRKFNRKWICLI